MAVPRSPCRKQSLVPWGVGSVHLDTSLTLGQSSKGETTRELSHPHGVAFPFLACPREGEDWPGSSVVEQGLTSTSALYSPWPASRAGSVHFKETLTHWGRGRGEPGTLFLRQPERWERETHEQPPTPLPAVAPVPPTPARWPPTSGLSAKRPAGEVFSTRAFCLSPVSAVKGPPTLRQGSGTEAFWRFSILPSDPWTPGKFFPHEACLLLLSEKESREEPAEGGWPCLSTLHITWNSLFILASPEQRLLEGRGWCPVCSSVSRGHCNPLSLTGLSWLQSTAFMINKQRQSLRSSVQRETWRALA